MNDFRLLTCFVALAACGGVVKADEALIGPLVGHTDSSSANLWARLPKAGVYRAIISAGDAVVVSVDAQATVAHDLTAQWRFNDLKPSTRYRYELQDDSGVTLASNEFRTAPAENEPARVSIAFGSCAREDAGSRAVWDRMMEEDIEGVVLGGDTPYIDSTDLTVQRRRYREFASVPEYQQLLATRPHWATWDDHDFGRNDSDGTLPGKENSRQAFTEYRALTSYGDGDGGIYTSFRRGPLEVFLLDTRWWSATAPSYADPKQKTLLGDAQWQWLQDSLRQSTAPFKLVACGVIWDDKQNKEKDDWNTYSSERRAFLDFVRRERIGGVVLLGGDIHVTRLLKYPAESTVGYPLYQFISSPIHSGVLSELNVPHPDLIESSESPHVFLKLTADSTMAPARLTAEFLNKDGRQLFLKVEVTEDELSPQ